jgi:apolipoprotein N-acyltransferase
MKKIALALGSGILMGLTTAPVEAWFLAWFALVPLWLIILQPRQEKNVEAIAQAAYKSKFIKLWQFASKDRAYLLAFLWGVGYHGIALAWITGIHPLTWMGVPWFASLSIAIFCWIAIVFWGASLVFIWSIGFKYLVKQIEKNSLINSNKQFIWIALIKVLLGVTFWCILEQLWSMTPLWWSSLSYTQSPHNLLILQLSQISGATTVTAAIVIVNGLIASVIGQLKQPFPQQPKQLVTFLSWPLIFLIGLHLIGLLIYIQPVVQIGKTPIKVGIIQGNVPNQIKLYSVGWRKALEGYTTGYNLLANENVDIILTPETALPFYWEDLVNNFNSFYSAIIARGVPVWLGAYGKQADNFTNSLFTITGDGKIFSRYNKAKLVPLGEYIPFERILGNIIHRISPLDNRLAAGKPNQIFQTPFGQAIAGICYESAFPEHFRYQASAGGEFILTVSNNDYYSKAMPAQHHAQDVIRAIESDRWLARATNTGYSAIIDPRGRTLWKSELDLYQLHTDTIYKQNSKTLYVRLGNWLVIFLSILTSIVILIYSAKLFLKS